MTSETAGGPGTATGGPAPAAQCAVLVAGPAGSGKSTLGSVLARRLGAPLLDQDVLTNPLVAVVAGLVGAGDDLDHPRLSALVREARYVTLLDAAAAQLACGSDVVVVAPFTAEAADPDRWERLDGGLRAAGASGVHLVWLDAGPALLERRLRTRDALRDRARTADPAAMRQYLAAIRRPAVPALLMDAGWTAERQAGAVLHHLRGT